MVKTAAELLLSLDRKVFYSARGDRLNSAMSAALKGVPAWKEDCEGLLVGEFKLENDRRRDLLNQDSYQYNALIHADFLKSKLGLAESEMNPTVAESKSRPQDSVLSAKLDKAILDWAGQPIELTILLTGISDRTVAEFAEMEAKSNTCAPREIVLRQNSASRVPRTWSLWRY